MDRLITQGDGSAQQRHGGRGQDGRVAAFQRRDRPSGRREGHKVVAPHRIQAQEGQHLVEVGADEADHIRARLGDRIKRAFDIPDLTRHGLTFRGARLLVAAGKPVAQLVYTLDDGSVFALCLTPRDGQPDVAPGLSRLDKFDAVIWRSAGTAMILLGPADRLDLMAASQTARLML